jgi:outer membrane protein assembly factor BamB
MRFAFALFIVALAPGASARSDTPVVLEQVVSRHDPALNVAQCRLAVGLDGNIYLASPHARGGYVLRVSPDGRVLGGGKVGYSLTAVAANRDGIVATAEAHFAHRTAFWAKDFSSLGHVPDFLVNDTVQWNAPSDVCAGESGNFYAIDQHRLRILKVTPPDKLAAAISLEKLGVQSKGGNVGLRVDEKRRRFFLAWPSGTVWAVGFDGKPLWNVKAHPAGEHHGGFDVDAEGKLYVVAGGQETVNVWNANGKPEAAVKLVDVPMRKPAPIHDLRVLGNELIVRRADPTILFDVHDRQTGKWRRAVRADVDVLTVRYPSSVWTASRSVSFDISFDAGPRLARPRFRIFVRPLGVPEFTEVALKDGAITPPADARGLYQVRVTPDLRGHVADHVLDGLVEIRSPDAVGSVSILTPLNRFYYGAGEAIPVSVIVRVPPQTKPIEKVAVFLKGPSGIAHRHEVSLKDGKGEFTLAAQQSRSLKPGRYSLDADVPGYTVAPQHLEIGPGLGTRPAFHLTQHGDYSLGFPPGPRPHGQLPRLIDLPETVADHLDRSRKLRLNLFVDRLGNLGNGVGEVVRDDELIQRLKADPSAVAPEKAMFEGSVRRTVAGYGAFGIEEQAILLNMDAGLPIGTLWDNRKPERMDADLKQAAEALKPYPAHRGWSWAANWWLEKHGVQAAEGAAEAAAYSAALKKAKETGAWSKVLDDVSTRTFSYAVAAEQRFRAVSNAIAPGKISTMTAPYRAIQTHPPTIFAHADEVDLHYQAEQIQPPQVTPHHVDFYKRPGKKAWGHPELWNDDGTGGMIFPTLLQMAMRGADGVGQSGPIGPWGGHHPDRRDPRNGAAGVTSAYRAIYELLDRFGPLLTKLENADQVAIAVSTRMQRIETWDGKIGSAYFDALFAAYNSCLYAHRPASFVFAEDLQPGSLRRFKAVLVIGQRVQLEPPWAAALAEARKDGIRVFHDDTCRPELVKDFAPLGVAFDRVKSDPSAWQDDAACERFPRYFKEHAAVLRRVLAPVVPPVAECANPEIMLTERRLGDARFIWAVNNAMLGWDPGLAWRTTLLITHRLPITATLKLDVPPGFVVHDVFAQKVLKPDAGMIPCDLRTMPARLYALVPAGKTLGEVAGERPAEDLFGPHVRDIAVSADGRTALANTFNWDQNLYAIDTASGATTWRGKVGHAFAFAPAAHAQGFAAQGFDVLSAEGYHLYLLNAQGKVDRRFALFGLPQRATSWASAGEVQEPGINAFAVSPAGRWVAASGGLGVAVWDSSGKELWADAWWPTSRKHIRLVTLDEQIVVTLDGATATARDAGDGRVRWSLTLADSGTLRGGTVSADRKTLVIDADTLGGRLFVIRNGKLVNTIVAAADEVAISADGSFIAAVSQRQLMAIDPAGGLLWTFTGDDTLRQPRISPDGERIAVGSELGTLTVLGKAGSVLAERDMHALPLPAWLPNLDLLVATWMGQVTRFDRNLTVRWQAKLTPAAESIATVPIKDATPTVRKTGWGNASPTPLPLTPNLLAETKATIGAVYSPRSHGDPRPWQNKVEFLTDGKPEAPPRPWLEWTDIGYINSGWRNQLTLEIDTFRTQMHVTAITFVEDPAHPESWLRDMRLEWWDAAKDSWQPGPYLLSDAAVHSHVLKQPLEAAKFRLVSSSAASWPVGNLRLGELVFHGKLLGPSHPDAVTGRPMAVLFDENEADLQCLKRAGVLDFRYADAFSGGKCLEVKKAGTYAPEWRPPFGHAIPNWDLEIAEKPGPGQYRYLRLAWKATSAETTGMSLLVGRAWPGGGVAVTVGDLKWTEGVIAEKRLPGPPPTEWREETIDLWEATRGKPPRIQSLCLRTQGGGALFDRIILTRSPAEPGR